MPAIRFPLDLEGKAEDAFICRLKEEQRLSRVMFSRQANEQPKPDGLVVISAIRGAEVVPVSGIYQLTLEIEFTLRVRRVGNSLATFGSICQAISNVFETHPAALAKQLTEERQDWKCYIAEVVGVDKTPKENIHRISWTLQIEAQDVNSKIANAIGFKNTLNV